MTIPPYLINFPYHLFWQYFFIWLWIIISFCNKVIFSFSYHQQKSKLQKNTEMKLIFIIFSLVSISSFSQNRSDIFLKQRVWKINSCVNDSLSLNQENIFLFYENKCCELNCKTENKQYFEPNVLILNSITIIELKLQKLKIKILLLLLLQTLKKENGSTKHLLIF